MQAAAEIIQTDPRMQQDRAMRAIGLVCHKQSGDLCHMSGGFLLGQLAEATLQCDAIVLSLCSNTTSNDYRGSVCHFAEASKIIYIYCSKCIRMKLEHTMLSSDEVHSIC